MSFLSLSNVRQSLLFLSLTSAIGIKQAVSQTIWSIAPRVGVNFSSAKYHGANLPYATSTSVISGIEAGGIVSLNQGHVQLQSGLLYTQQGFEVKGNYRNAQSSNGEYINVDIFHQFNYLTLPLTVGYSQRKNGSGFQVLAGGYISNLLGGHVDYNNTKGAAGTTPLIYQESRRVRPGESFQDVDNFYSSRFDVGVQAGVGYSYKSFLLQAVYRVGVKNLGADFPLNPVPYNKGSEYYNRSLNISLAYLLRLDNK